MLVSAIVHIVRFCIRHPKAIIAAYALLGIASAYYAATHFAINTDVNKLLSPTLDWRQRELDFEKSFPGRYDSILVVVDAPTPELASSATRALAQRLKANQTEFRSVEEVASGAFFTRQGLLFQPVEELSKTTQALAQAGPLVRTLVTDPSLRGLTQVVTLLMSGVRGNMVSLDDLARPLTVAAETVENVLSGGDASFSWQGLMNERAGEPGQLRGLIQVRPVLDFSALEPGGRGADAIRSAASELDLAGEHRARVRLTGPVAMADEEFSTVRDGALRDMAATIVVVLVILWLALRSGKLILAVFLNMFVGLAATAALGLMMVDALNPISIAFAVLFIGLGVDFGIQFAVRYRAERHEKDDLHIALLETAKRIGAPLTLAAAAVAAAFLSFTPTDYSGISELGVIAGMGMLIAFITSITHLPALLTALSPAGEPEEIGYRALAPVDRFLERNRVAVVGGTALVALLGTPLLYFLSFDINPLNLRNKNVESVATLLDLSSDPNIGANSIAVLTRSPAEAAATADRLRQLPESGRVVTLASFVPDHQDQKLALIAELKQKLGPALDAKPRPAPSDAENIAALRRAADFTIEIVGNRTGPGADAAKRLAADLTRLANADKAARDKVAATFLRPLKAVLDEWRERLQAQPVSFETLPPELVHDWITADGRVRVDVMPKGDPNDTEVLRAFARAVLAVYPNATGAPISILKAGETVISAFLQAGIHALLSITILLWIVLKRFGDVLLTLVPLLLAGVLTLEICVLIGMPLNFANIIALPLLLGVGVAFKIYYIMAWRAGQTNLLQSSLTRAVIWSALTTATAFGSLWMSNHPGTSSMGELLALSLVTTMCFAVLFQPALMGRPRNAKTDSDVKEPVPAAEG
jgi:hopanoid biosynthesis associated RND transporter like protein HpnN